jgi:YD repeat-containing protein
MRSYDAAGNTTGYAGTSFTFDNRGRMVQADYGGNTATYVCNALGHRVKHVGPSGTSLYAYDEAGHLLGEYDGSGALIQETVCLGDIPVSGERDEAQCIHHRYVPLGRIRPEVRHARPAGCSIT